MLMVDQAVLRRPTSLATERRLYEPTRRKATILNRDLINKTTPDRFSSRVVHVELETCTKRFSCEAARFMICYDSRRAGLFCDYDSISGLLYFMTGGSGRCKYPPASFFDLFLVSIPSLGTYHGLTLLYSMVLKVLEHKIDNYSLDK